jgi:chaperonin GroES
LYIPEIAKEKPTHGVVIAVGIGRLNEKTGEIIPIDVRVGDKILFGKYSGSETKFEGKELLIVREEEILGVME